MNPLPPAFAGLRSGITLLSLALVAQAGAVAASPEPGPRLPSARAPYRPPTYTAPAARKTGYQPVGRLGKKQKWVLIDLHRRPQVVTCYEGSRIVDLYACSGSRFGTSDRGWAVAGRRLRQSWYRGSADSAPYWMQWWVGIVPDTAWGREWARKRGYNGFHTTPSHGLARLGRPASHGCIRLNPADSPRFWKWMETGVPLYFSVLKPADPERLLTELRGRPRSRAGTPPVRRARAAKSYEG